MSALLAAQVAVLIEAILLVSALGSQFLKWLVPLFLPVAIVAFALIGLMWRRQAHPAPESKTELKAIDYFGALQMSFLITALLVASQYLLKAFGEQSLLWAHFGLALFEVHGAFISAVQLQLAQKVTLPWAVLLLTVSLSASFVSKFFIVLFMGTRDFLKALSLTFGILLIVLWGAYGFLLYTLS